ncbi:hypothetical protein DFR71_1867 [Nocardia alba]|uniref:Uncharacterized protein n=1 Tax=Nocardia alba TaxID=225051 RepID=A0A4R1FZW4_9NOCA|nr:hypothetical protein DFR71_1867 [Nocardia alba]
MQQSVMVQCRRQRKVPGPLTTDQREGRAQCLGSTRGRAWPGAMGEHPGGQRNHQQQRDFRRSRHRAATDPVRGDRQPAHEYAAATTA